MRRIQGRLLNMQKYKARKKLEELGLKWHEDKRGKVKIWIRLNKEKNSKLKY